MLGLLSAAVSLGTIVPASFAAGNSNGAVFVMTNAADVNEVIAFARNANGKLQERARYNTEGRGSGGNGDPLQSQGSLSFSPDGTELYAVNAGSGTISTFHVRNNALIFAGQTPSGGSEPVAVAQLGNLVYVLNAGAAGSLVGFHQDGNGRLQTIANSTTFLSAKYTGGASVSFSPNGRFLAVVERAANTLSIFQVKADGTLGPIHSMPSPGAGAFSGRFALDGKLLVSETGPANATNASAISSYTVNNDGSLSPISLSVPTYGNADCWNATTPDGKYVYVDNAASGTISGFAVGKGGTLTAIGDTIVATLPDGSTNLDLTVTPDGKYLYTLNAGTGSIGIFSIDSDGSLTNIGQQEGLTPNASFNGIAAQ